MSELKVRPYTMLPSGQCYDRDEVNKFIAEKDAEIAELKQKLDKAIAERDGNQVCIDALNEKLGVVNEFIKASKELLNHRRCTKGVRIMRQSKFAG